MFAPQAWFVVAASYVALLFAYGLPQDFQYAAPSYIALTWVALMIRTFLYHLGLLLVVITGVALTLRRRWLTLAALPLVVVTIGPEVSRWIPRRPPATAGEAVTVMTVNLLYANQDTAPLIGEIRTARPDILLLQEYTPEWHLAVQHALGTEYPFVQQVVRDDSFGSAVYARRDFTGPVDTGLPLGSWDLPQMRAVISIAGRHVALYNIHLLPPRNLTYAAEQRVEFGALLALLQAEELPIVLCGDFNFAGRSAFADELERLGLRDVHAISGWGRGATWPVLGLFRALPGIRLDHIYVSGELTSSTCRTGTGQGSDHRPVVGVIGFADLDGPDARR